MTQEGGIEAAKRFMICPFIKNGKKCRHKERCWFSHAEVDDNEATSNASKVNLGTGAEKTVLDATTSDSGNSQEGSTDRKEADKVEESNRHKTECGICQNSIPLKVRPIQLLISTFQIIDEMISLILQTSHSLSNNCIS